MRLTARDLSTRQCTLVVAGQISSTSLYAPPTIVIIIIIITATTTSCYSNDSNMHRYHTMHRICQVAPMYSLSNTSFHWASTSLPLDRFSVFAKLTRVPNTQRHTDHATPSVANAAMRPNNNTNVKVYGRSSRGSPQN